MGVTRRIGTESMAKAAPTEPRDIPAASCANGPSMDSKKETPSCIVNVSRNGSHTEGIFLSKDCGYLAYQVCKKVEFALYLQITQWIKRFSMSQSVTFDIFFLVGIGHRHGDQHNRDSSQDAECQERDIEPSVRIQK